jgi:hypothetical protein
VRLRVVFIDTTRSNWQFKDENSNSEWAKVIQHLQQFADATNGVAIATHHPPKSGIGESGGGSARAGLDYILTASCDRNDETGEIKNRRLALTKHRDGETGVISAFELKKVALGILDAFGQEITSIVAVPTDGPASAAAAKAENDTIVTFRRAFDEALSVAGRDHRVMESGDVESPIVMAASIKVVRREFYKRYVTGDEDEKRAQENRRKAFQRALKALINKYGREVLSDGEEVIWRL